MTNWNDDARATWVGGVVHGLLSPPRQVLAAHTPHTVEQPKRRAMVCEGRDGCTLSEAERAIAARVRGEPATWEEGAR